MSAQPGLVPQEKGQVTRARIWGATVFVDYSGVGTGRGTGGRVTHI